MAVTVTFLFKICKLGDYNCLNNISKIHYKILLYNVSKNKFHIICYLIVISNSSSFKIIYWFRFLIFVLEARQDKVKRRYLGKVARKFLKFSLVVFFPNSIEKSQDPNGRKTSPAAYKLMSLYDTVGLTIRDQLEMQLSKDDIHEVNLY